MFAWSGVGAFALSLAYFVWFYFARLDGLAAREPATTSLLWNIGLFAFAKPHRTRHHIPNLKSPGPTRWLRHPLYLGLLLILFGAPRMTADRLIFSALILVYVLFAIQWEERGMRRTFGRDYDRYREAVRWKLVPGLY